MSTVQSARPDVEMARQEAELIITKATANLNATNSSITAYEWQAIRQMAQNALRALDGEGAEEWTAARDGYGTWYVHQANHSIAYDLSESTARRIARLPALERAARRALAACPPNTHLNEHQTAQAFAQVFNELRAALTDNPEV